MTSYTLQVTIDETLLQQGCGDNLDLARKVNGVMNAVLLASALSFFTWIEKYKICLVAPPSNDEFIERATEDVPIDVGEVTTFYEYSLSEPADEQPAGFFPNAGSFGVKGVPSSLNASILMSTGGQWSTIYVDQSSQNGQVAVPQPQKYYLFWKERAENEKLYQLNEADGRRIIFTAGETSKGIHFGFKNPGTPEAPS